MSFSRVGLTGEKCWQSGAAMISHAAMVDDSF